MRSFLWRRAVGGRVTFETVPVVHLEHGRFPEYPGGEVERVLTDLARRFERVAIVDASGVRANDPDLVLIQQASKRRALWLDAGSRFATDAMDLFIAGASAVTMRWNTLNKPKELEEAAHICQPGTLFVGLEFPRGEFLPHRKDARTAEEVAQWCSDLDVGIVYQTHDADASFLRRLPVAQAPRYVQGVAARHVADAQAMGFAGALLAPVEIPEESA